MNGPWQPRSMRGSVREISGVNTSRRTQSYNGHFTLHGYPADMLAMIYDAGDAGALIDENGSWSGSTLSILRSDFSIERIATPGGPPRFVLKDEVLILSRKSDSDDCFQGPVSWRPERREPPRDDFPRGPRYRFHRDRGRRRDPDY
jgi:hypothetical protein